MIVSLYSSSDRKNKLIIYGAVRSERKCGNSKLARYTIVLQGFSLEDTRRKLVCEGRLLESCPEHYFLERFDRIKLNDGRPIKAYDIRAALYPPDNAAGAPAMLALSYYKKSLGTALFRIMNQPKAK
ncbi:hypothetical protein [Ruminococcus sp. Marseille-P6503]|uniref:hypothetical protein n=1 Tax=Ruminococcus sp. Marseille-P6503 TaxID=2364796 RepID=UPI000F526FAC|nr:hypothetical protein [Ruminococcus sp. Marseille-P6503]